MGVSRRWFSETAPPIAIYLGIGVIITLIFFAVSGEQARVGTFRSVSAILSKFAELASVGLALGLVASLGRRRIDTSLLTLGIGFVALLDVDHLPSLFGIAQPIRPAHSFAYLAVTVLVLALLIRNKLDVELIAVSAFLGHIAADTGIFAPLARFSFDYVPTEDFRIPFAVGAVVFALLAGRARFAREKPAFGFATK